MNWGLFLIGISMIAISGVFNMVEKSIKEEKMGKRKAFLMGALTAAMVEIFIILGTIFLTKGINKDDDDIDGPTFCPLHPGPSVTSPPPISAIILPTPSPFVQESSPPPATESVATPKSSPIPTPDHTSPTHETLSAHPEPGPTPTIPVIDISDVLPPPAKTDDPPPLETDPSEPILPPYEPEEPDMQEPEALKFISGVITTINYSPMGVTLTVEAENGTAVSVTLDHDMTIYRRNTMEYIGTDSLRTGWDCIIYFSEDGEVQEIEVSTEYHVLKGIIEEVHFQEDSSEVLLRIKASDGASEIKPAYSGIINFNNGDIIGRECEFLYWDDNIIFAIHFLD